jgi:hypothetical protein
VWDLESGECLRTLEGHTAIRSVGVTADGKKVVSESSALQVWDLESGECLRTLIGGILPAGSVSVTPDGKIAVSGGRDRDHILRVWDLESGECLRKLRGHTEWVSSVSVIPDGKRAVSGSSDNTLRVWNLESGACLKTLKGHTGRVSSVSVTPDGKRAVSGSSDNTLRVWDLESGECIAAYQARGGVASISEIGADGCFIYGADVGEVIFLICRNFPMELSVVTSIRIWLYGESGQNGQWEDDVSGACRWCGRRFLVADEILEVTTTITHNANLSPDQSPCLELPAEAWDEPRLLSECPHCHKPLRFNPFVVDNRDRY